jgi:hypothetical protein
VLPLPRAPAKKPARCFLFFLFSPIFPSMLVYYYYYLGGGQVWAPIRPRLQEARRERRENTIMSLSTMVGAPSWPSAMGGAKGGMKGLQHLIRDIRNCTAAAAPAPAAPYLAHTHIPPPPLSETRLAC